METILPVITLGGPCPPRTPKLIVDIDYLINGQNEPIITMILGFWSTDQQSTISLGVLGGLGPPSVFVGKIVSIHRIEWFRSNARSTDEYFAGFEAGCVPPLGWVMRVGASCNHESWSLTSLSCVCPCV